MSTERYIRDPLIDLRERAETAEADRSAAVELVGFLRGALALIAARGPVFDAKGTWSKQVWEIASAALRHADEIMPRADAFLERREGWGYDDMET